LNSLSSDPTPPREIDRGLSLTGSSSNAPVRVFFILNPVAGKTDANDIENFIQTACASRDIEYEIHRTRKDEDLQKVTSGAIQQGFRRFVASGGDGTVAMVAACLVDTDIPLGIIPGGSGNVLAKELNIPLDPAQAIELALEAPKIRILDGMRANGKYYFLNVGAGVSSLTIANTRREDKRKFGLIAYLYRGLEQLKGFRPHRFRVIADGKEFRQRASEVMVVNASIMGSRPFQWDPDIAPDDRSLEVCTISAQRLEDLPGFLFDLILNRQRESPYITCVSVKKGVVLDASRKIPVQGDGEIIGNTPIEVQIVPAALRVIVPEA
jgi:YegS/Rv2252/BmrU family lipid kinase